MSKPPATPPHSDIDGIHEDEQRNTDVAHATGQNADDLESARKESKGRPDYGHSPPNRDDHSD